MLLTSNPARPSVSRSTLFLSACLLGGLFLCPVQATADDLQLEAEDGMALAATFRLPEGASSKQPAAAVILIHQGGSDRSEWSFLFQPLLDQGFAVLSYDVRGHGASGRVDDIYALFNDPEQAPLDLAAALDYLQRHSQVDGERIAVVGSSIGANLAAAAASAGSVRTAVAISGKTSAARNLAGGGKLRPKSVFYISSEGDQDGKRAAWVQELFELTAEPRRKAIVEGSSAHGVGIFPDSPRLVEDIIDWLAETL